MTSTWINTRKCEAVNPETEVWNTLRRWHGQQRLGHNLTLEASRNEGRLPARQKSPNHPNGLLGRLTPPDGMFAQDPRVDRKETPLWVHRAGVTTGRNAAKAHSEHCKNLARRVIEDLKDEEAWGRWMQQWPHEEKERLRDVWEDPKTRNAWLKEHGKALPKRVARCIRGPSVVTPRVRRWHDRLRRKRREPRVRVTSFEPGKRLDDHHLQLAGGVVIEVKDILPPEWAMVSYQLVETTPHAGRYTRDDQRQLKVHIQTREACVATTRLHGQHERWAGVDLGITRTVTLHEGTTWSLPDRTDLEEALVEAQQEMARRNHGSWRWRRARQKIRKIHRTAVNRDTQAMWDFAYWLAARYDVVVLEDLRLKNMSSIGKGSITLNRAGSGAKRALNRALRRASLGKLKAILCRAFTKRGKIHKVVNPRGTSTTCHACSHKDPSSRETQAEFRCTRCGHEANADVNAARNVRTRGWTGDGPPPWTRGGDCPWTWGATETHLRSPPGPG